MKSTDEPIVVEQTLEVSADIVWDAITKVEKMRQWFFDTISSFEPEVGFSTRFNVKSGDRDFLHVWKITEVVPMQKIAYDWRFEGYTGAACSVFELSENDDSTTLKLIFHTHEDFPDGIPEFERQSGVEGWKFFIQKSLKDFVERTL